MLGTPRALETDIPLRNGHESSTRPKSTLFQFESSKNEYFLQIFPVIDPIEFG